MMVIIVDSNLLAAISLTAYVLIGFICLLGRKLSLPKFLFLTVAYMAMIELLNIFIIPIISYSPQNKFHGSLLPFLTIKEAIRYADQYDSAKSIQQEILALYFYGFALSLSYSFSLSAALGEKRWTRVKILLCTLSVPTLSIVLTMCGLIIKPIDTATYIFVIIGTFWGLKLKKCCQDPINKLLQANSFSEWISSRKGP